MFTDLERAVEEAVASPQWSEVRDTEPRQFVTQSGPKKCIHSLLINIYRINLNEISIAG